MLFYFLLARKFIFSLQNDTFLSTFVSLSYGGHELFYRWVTNSCTKRDHYNSCSMRKLFVFFFAVHEFCPCTHVLSSSGLELTRSSENVYKNAIKCYFSISVRSYYIFEKIGLVSEESCIILHLSSWLLKSKFFRAHSNLSTSTDVPPSVKDEHSLIFVFSALAYCAFLSVPSF
jgi:hypothetical protein